MRNVYINDEEDSLNIDQDFDTTDFVIFPKDKKITVDRSIKDDCFYTNQVMEYKVSVNPIELHMRTLESSSEPPLEYSIKDGVVLESNLQKKDFIFPDRIENLKKEIEWNKISIFGNYEVNLYILSKHPEIISKEEYRRFLRQSVEKIKLGVHKVEESVKKNTHGLEIQANENGKYVWYPTNELEKKEFDEYWEMSEEEKKESQYGKKLEYAEQFSNSLFKEDSYEYAGIEEYEFRNSNEITDYIEKLLDKKEKLVIENKEIIPQQHPNKIFSLVIYLLTCFFIVLKLTDGVDWGWFAVIFPVLLWEGLGFIIAFLKGVAK